VALVTYCAPDYGIKSMIVMFYLMISFLSGVTSWPLDSRVITSEVKKTVYLPLNEIRELKESPLLVP